MKLARLIGIAMLAILVSIGLLSTVLLPKIEAALLASGGQTSALSVAAMRNSVPTVVRATPTKAQPMSMVLAQDTFQRADHAFWGVASDGQMWGADANSLPGFTTMNHSGRIINGQGAYNATLGPPSTNADVVFSGSQLMARAWPTGKAEPQNWLAMATDNTFTNGFGGLRPFVVKDVNVTIT